MIAKLLIANRGEIACRIMRTARAMGIATVAVYSDADAKALHVRSADEAVHIGASPAAESYLRGERIIAAAKETGAEAIHPGYGFLSENAEFAQAVLDAGLIWVGPKPTSIAAMGLKDAAKQLMRAANVPVTPGYDGLEQGPALLSEKAKEIGYPVLIKAVAGGGGKGMRKVEREQDFEAALESCKREARSSFGNDAVLLEKWINTPRHIEVQVFGDAHGNVVHLFERDCSLQRRHQKVIEEAPAPGMDAETREAICAAAVRAAKAVDYEGAGTVEFIADASDGLSADRIFFMEMNTRLQVEHPVTEEITGVDLVEWQLRVASGEPLPLAQDALSINGHAIEARLYAEDPASGFLPSVGKIELLNLGFFSPYFEPEGLRVDTGVTAKDTVHPHYDPMIAKMIVWAEERKDAAENLSSALAHSLVWPVRTNAPFLVRALDHEEFLDGNLTTAFIETYADDLMPIVEPHPDLLNLVARKLRDETSITSFKASNGHLGPWELPTGLRLNAPSNVRFAVAAENKRYEVEVSLLPTEEDFVDQETLHLPEGIYTVEEGKTWLFSPYRYEPGDSATAGNGTILAPMPGKVIACDVAAGDTVTAGQRLIVLEAMKMEHALTAPFDGTVAELAVGEGDQVQVDALLVRVEATSE